MDLKEQLVHAIHIAIRAHGEQKDRNGQPYIGHCFRVMNAGQTIEEKIVGVLHDVLEDTELTIGDLLIEGFSEEMVDAVHTLSKLENEDYDHYLRRVMRCNLATRVKLNDLTDNMDLRRLETLEDEDIFRMRKYLNAYNQLTNK